MATIYTGSMSWRSPGGTITTKLVERREIACHGYMQLYVSIYFSPYIGSGPRHMSKYYVSQDI